MAICIYNKKQRAGSRFTKKPLGDSVGGSPTLANLQKYFGQVFQTPFEIPLKPSVTQIGTFYPACTIKRVDYGSLSFYGNYLTKVS